MAAPTARAAPKTTILLFTLFPPISREPGPAGTPLVPGGHVPRSEVHNRRHGRCHIRSAEAVAEHGPFHAEALPGTVDLDRAAVAGAVPARHRRLPRELRSRADPPHGLQHRLRPAREHVEPFQATLCYKDRVDDDLRLGGKQ